MATIGEALTLASQMLQSQQFPAARQLCLQILAVAPQQAEALRLLGLIALGDGQPQVAAEWFQRAIAIHPHLPRFYGDLAAAYRDWGRTDEAIDCYRQALQFDPDMVEALNNLGNLLKSRGQFDLAIDYYQRALRVAPSDTEVLNNLANAHRAQRRHLLAITCYQRALEIQPRVARTRYNLGTTLQDLGRFDEALTHYEQAIQLDPGLIEAYNNLGIALQDLGKLHEAAACLQRAIELAPHDNRLLANLGNVFAAQGRLREAAECYRRALQNADALPAIHSAALLGEQYRYGVTLAELASAHDEWDRRHAAPIRKDRQFSYTNLRDPGRPLRLGFVSADFGSHPVGYFLICAFEHLDPQLAQSVCYCNRSLQGDMPNRFHQAAHSWRDIVDRSDAQVEEQIRTDGIDILFDLAGHTAGGRLLLFARKPAPIQITWAGYVGTTGLHTMDYILADRYHIPPESQQHYREKVLRMPDAWLCFDPPGDAPLVEPLPANRAESITFGSFNNPAKITSAVVQVWAQILQRVPRSRLVLKYRGMNDVSVTTRLAEQFASHGIDPQRLTFFGASPRAELLGQYNQIDIALDPFPYSGGLTTCEALWMGVPVVTCAGETFASRHGLSILQNVGLTPTIAHDLEAYCNAAVALCDDLTRLAALRAGLREQVAASALCDGPKFSNHLLELLRGVWRAWVANT